MLKLNKIFCSPKMGLMILLGGILYAPATMAQSSQVKLGVVLSRENITQWEQISSRLNDSSINYCVLDTRQWQSPQDLQSLDVLFLPNVNNINNAQASALKSWVNNGGKVIASGPTGESSSGEVKQTLREVFGAYWAYPISQASSLVLNNPENNKNILASNSLIGGVIVPTNSDNQTKASWSMDGNPPAVISNNHSTFLGWRWGVDNISNSEFDVAWLTNILNGYGVNSVPPFALGEVLPCEQSPRQPFNPPNQNSQQTPPSNQVAQNNLFSATRSQPQDRMIKELQQLVHRVQNTLIKADSQQEIYKTSMAQVVQQLSQGTNKQRSLIHSNIFAHNAINHAQQIIQNFPELASQDFNNARQNWLDARRRLWDNYPVDRHFAQSEVRGIWLDRGTIVKAKSKADLEPLFDRFAQAGINTIFFETVNASYPIYPSRVAPEQNPMTRGWDPLQAAIELAHERDMELHAWAWIFAGANEGHNRLLNLPDNYLGPVLSRNPSWVLKDKDGQAFNRTPGFKKAFIDPANPQAKEYLHRLLEEIVTNYDVDGIQYDYIRYPFQDGTTRQNFGYTQVSRRAFQNAYGVDPQTLTPSSPLWSQWLGFRIRQVDSFVQESSRRLKAIDPDVTISAAVFPMDRQGRLNVLQQNWEEWIRNQSVDMMVLMTYALDTGSFESRLESLNDPSLNNSSSLIIPGIRLLNVPDTEALDQVQLLRNLPTSGFALFAAENLDSNLETIFQKTQGGDTMIPQFLPHRQPFKVASQRYQALVQEWNFVLLNGQMAIASGYLENWATNADNLNQALAKLAENPSQSNLRQAKNSLQRFKGQFSNYTREHGNIQPLQVESWQNRLVTIENLLNYGERMEQN
ncbi:family 10 glycosylhydrolase [Cyanobacterium stanieri LEGE 03274]|uniref:Family 10 glycosylhydrolase n=1 Tax=Cyanobacterium stanieri LEGE 03274 TaxID=1828756 RepID=A0ABR9V5R9_9CHRO|nr:family 10 glycosylhydrolase [Cyanobacterium stanieri]MBE9223235.1 family 10 glycosylhydrolase [Cyanobacterium stanieri LEGE 03274]